MNENQTMMEAPSNNNKKNNLSILLVIVICAICLVGGIFVGKKFFTTDETNNITNNESSKKDDKKVEEKKDNKIEVTENLQKELREMIPNVTYCNRYLDKQYNGGTFYATDWTEEDKTSDFSECQELLDVYSVADKVESTEDEVYLYDYILLYSLQGECYNWDDNNQCTDNYDYGTVYNKLHLKYEEIQKSDVYEVGNDDVKQFGQLYKYTFILKNGVFSYYSTEIVK